jgi:hypothetical protein
MRLIRVLFCAAALLAAVSCCDTPTAPTSSSLPTGGISLITVTGKNHLTVGEKSAMKAVALFTDGSQQDVTLTAQWRSDNTSVCTVDGRGVVTAVATGRCTVSATVRNLTGTIVIDVSTVTTPEGNGGPTPLVATGLAVQGASPLTVGQTTQWHAIVLFNDGTSQDVTALATWSSESSGVASVAGGLVRGVSVGTSRINASYTGLTAGGTIQITAAGGPPAPTVLSLTVSGDTTIAAGESTQWQVIAQMSDGTTQNVTTAATWGSGTPSVAGVVGGLVTGIGQGSSPITASFGGKSATATVQVSAPTVLSLSISGNTSLSVGGTSQLQATAHFSNGATQIVTPEASWTSGTPGTATVASGLVTGVSPGSSQITAGFGGKSASITVQVNATAATVLSLTITGNTSLTVGGANQLQAIASMSDGTTQNVTASSTWTSGTTSVATVSSGLVTGVSAGTSLITASFGGKTASVTVTVSNTPATVLSLSISGNTTLTVGGQSQLQATASMSDGTTQNVTASSSWTSATLGVATVTSGLLTGVSGGSSLITASFSGKSASVTANVSTTPPTVLSLSISGNTSLTVGGTSQLQATASMSNGTTQNVTSLATWTSGTTSVATVAAGLVSGASVGSSLITASFGGKSASVTVTVGNTPVTVLSLSVTGNTALQVGGTSQLQATASMSDGSTQNVTASATWTSATTSVATVSSGLVSGVSVGSSLITASFGGKSASVTVTVSAGAPQLIGLEAQLTLNGGTVLTGSQSKPINLNLADLLSGNPIVGLKVFGLYSDGSKQDVTSLATIDTSAQLLSIDNQGTAAVLALLVQGLINPNHYVNVSYGGFTANVVVNLNLPVLQSLGIGNGQPFTLRAGNQIPALQTVFSQNISSDVSSGVPGVVYNFQLASPVTQLLQGIPIAGPALLGSLNTVVNGLSVVNGVLTLAPGTESLLNTALSNPLLAPVLAPGGLLPLDLTATLNGVVSTPVRVNLGGS